MANPHKTGEFWTLFIAIGAKVAEHFGWLPKGLADGLAIAGGGYAGGRCISKALDKDKAPFAE